MKVTALVVAKSPVPGLAKTRLAATLGNAAAADIAAAALLDTLDAVSAADFDHRVRAPLRPESTAEFFDCSGSRGAAWQPGRHPLRARTET